MPRYPSPFFTTQEEDTGMTILIKPIKRELPQRVAHRHTAVEFHPGFIRLRGKHSILEQRGIAVS